MTTPDPRYFTKLMNGNYVEKKLYATVDKIYDEFGDKVKIMYLDRAGTGPEALVEEPWVICEWVEQTQTWEKIFGVMEMDDRVLHRLRELDMLGKKAAEVIAEIERKEAEFRDRPKKEFEDWRKNEAIPLIAAAFKSDKTFRFKNEEGEWVTLHG